MKKYMTWIFMFVIVTLFCMPVSAEIVMNVEYFENGTETVLPETDPPGLIEVNGVKYINLRGPGGQMLAYNGNEDVYLSYTNNLEKIRLSSHCIWTGEYFMVRDGYLDHPNAPKYAKERPYLFGIEPLQFYDINFNLVKTVRFEDDEYIKKATYVDGTYYCYVERPNGFGYYASTDLENWEVVRGAIPEKTGNVTYKLNNLVQKEESLFAFEDLFSLNGSDYYGLVSEGDQRAGGGTSFGQWRIQSGFGRLQYDLPAKMYITNDSIYNVVLSFDKDLKTYEPYTADSYYQAYQIQQIYENGDNLVIDLKKFRLTTPKQPVYDALNAIKDAPYVRVGNEILGFETPPVTESDRTLVPMRFLFEQLGADVTWDEATETATAKKANTTINFSIDNTTATVNGAETVMDVPARLVGDKTMVPLRFLSEEMGYTVEWDEETRMATVITPE